MWGSIIYCSPAENTKLPTQQCANMARWVRGPTWVRRGIVGVDAPVMLGCWRSERIFVVVRATANQRVFSTGYLQHDRGKRGGSGGGRGARMIQHEHAWNGRVRAKPTLVAYPVYELGVRRARTCGICPLSPHRESEYASHDHGRGYESGQPSSCCA